LSVEGPIQLLALLSLSLAAGVDLYLTLLFLGTAARLGWETPPPGALGDLAVPAVLGAAAFVYVLEWWMERSAFWSASWNAAHTIIRPMGGALLAWMALADLPPTTRWSGVFAAAALTLATHVTRSGWGLLMALMPVPARIRLLVSVAEDVGVLALLSLLLDSSAAAAGLAAFAIVAGLRWGGSASSAFSFSIRLLWDSAQGLLRHRRWRPPERFPGWIRKTLEDPALAPGGGLRGSPAGAVNLPGIGLFRRGWVVVRGGSPLFLYRWRRQPHTLDLGNGQVVAVTPATLHTRLDLGDERGRRFALYFSLDGPDAEDLRAQFRL
jgi:hypothetical protein